MCVACRYTSTKKPVELLDDEGQTIPTEYDLDADDFAFRLYSAVGEPVEPDGNRADVREAIAEFIRRMIDDGDLDPVVIGRNMICMAANNGIGRAGQLTGNELAELFGVGKARMSQLKAESAKLFPEIKPRKIRGKAAQLRAAAKLQS